MNFFLLFLEKFQQEINKKQINKKIARELGTLHCIQLYTQLHLFTDGLAKKKMNSLCRFISPNYFTI